MDLDEYFNSHPEMRDSVTDDYIKSGFVTFVGRPNAGKSTLINTLVGEKIAITSNTAQTTRHRFRGVVNRESSQIVICDTPGIHKPKDCLGEELNISALEAIKDVDVICFLIDATKPFGSGDKWILDQIKCLKETKYLIVTKTDIASSKQVLEQIKAANDYCAFDETIPISAINFDNCETLLDLIEDKLEPGPAWFSRDATSDVSEEVMIAELIREPILRTCRDEVPHSIGVQIENMDYNKKSNVEHIFARIFVERDSQVGIIVGKSGIRLKQIGETARKDIEKFLKCKCNLQLTVKVKKDWRYDANAIRKFGYGE